MTAIERNIFNDGHMVGAQDAANDGKRRRFTFAHAVWMLGYRAGFKYGMWIRKG